MIKYKKEQLVRRRKDITINKKKILNYFNKQVCDIIIKGNNIYC